MNHHIRYWLFQIPGIVLAALVGGSLYYFERVTLSTAFLILGAWVIKDAALYPILVHAFRTEGTKTGIEKMIGMVGTVRQELQPEGIIWVRGERWKAITDSPQTITKGTLVKVIHAKQLTITVAPYEKDSVEQHNSTEE